LLRKRAAARTRLGGGLPNPPFFIIKLGKKAVPGDNPVATENKEVENFSIYDPEPKMPGGMIVSERKIL